MMKGFFSKLFACKCSASSDQEVVAAIAVALQLYGQQQGGSKTMAVNALRTTAKATSSWSCKSYGMTQLPQRNRTW